MMSITGLEEDVHHGQIVFEVFLICILWVACILGNILVCLVIYRSRRVQSTTNYFIVGLASIDLLFALTTLPWITGRIVAGNWPFGDFMCRITRFLQHFTLGVTSFVLMCISIDRFYTIIYPLTFKVTRGTSKRMIILACVISIIFSSFSFYFYEEVSVMKHNTSRTVCPTYMDVSTKRWTGVAFLISLLITQYILPVIVIFVLYTKVFNYIWRPSGTCLQFQRTMNSVPRTKVKMVRMLMITTLSNVLLVTPVYFLQVIVSLVQPSYMDPFWYCIFVIVMFSSSVVKPVIYMCYNSNFRRGCREVFCMSSMQCYRGEVYAITNISSIGKRNHVGVVNGDMQQSIESPSRAFDRDLNNEKNKWPLPGPVPTTCL